MAEQVRPFLMKNDPEAWAEVLRVCGVASNTGHSPSVAAKHLRHLGVTHHSLVRWINAGLIPAYHPNIRYRSGNISHLL